MKIFKLMTLQQDLDGNLPGVGSPQNTSLPPTES